MCYYDYIDIYSSKNEALEELSQYEPKVTYGQDGSRSGFWVVEHWVEPWEATEEEWNDVGDEWRNSKHFYPNYLEPYGIDEAKRYVLQKWKQSQKKKDIEEEL